MFNLRIEKSIHHDNGEISGWDTSNQEIRDLKDLALYISAAFVSIAKEELSVSQSKGKFPKEGFRTIVDGRYDVGNNLTNAHKEIVFVSKVAIGDVLVEMMKSVVDRSPLDTGQYIRNHALFLNSYLVGRTPQEVATWLNSNPNIKAGDAIRLVNLTPYAGKLEREGFRAGKTLGGKSEQTKRMKKFGKKGAQVSVRQPNGAYYLTVRKLLLKYRFNSIIKFEWVNGGKIPGLNNMTFVNQRGYRQGSGGAVMGSKTKHKTKTKPYAYPSILIYVKEGGIIL